MQIELKRIQTEVGITFVHVTHDQEEAMTMADSVAVMNAGVVEQLGPPVELYERPRTTFVANFLGQSNLVRGLVAGSAHPAGGDVRVDVPGGSVVAPASGSARREGEVWVGVRPEKVVLRPDDEPAGGGENVLRGGVVTDVSYCGVSTQYLARMPWGQELTVFAQNTGAARPVSVGDRVALSWRREHTFLLDADQDAAAGVDRDAVPGPAAHA